jgi:hypothetical protein
LGQGDGPEREHCLLSVGRCREGGWQKSEDECEAAEAHAHHTMRVSLDSPGGLRRNTLFVARMPAIRRLHHIQTCQGLR